jgi:hypothetical protein
VLFKPGVQILKEIREPKSDEIAATERKEGKGAFRQMIPKDAARRTSFTSGFDTYSV